MDLARWKLADKADREFALTGKIPAGETLSLMLVNTQMVLANGGGPVKLIDAAGGARQTVSYTRQQARCGAFVLFGN